MREPSFGTEVGMGICEPPAQVSTIVAVLVSACLAVLESAIHLSTQAIFHTLAASSLLVWLGAHLPKASMKNRRELDDVFGSVASFPKLLWIE